MENRAFMKQLCDLFMNVECDEELDVLRCPKCGKKMKFVSYAEKFNIKASFVSKKDGYWKCNNCNICCTSTYNYEKLLKNKKYRR